MSTPAVTPSNSALDQTDLEIPSGSAYDEWRKTGAIPDSEEEAAKLEAEISEKDKQEEAERLKKEPLTPEESAASEAAPSVTPAASEAARPQKKDANARIRELNAELKKYRERYEQAMERQLSAAPAQPSVKQEPRPAETSKAAENKPPSLDDKDDKGDPKYKTMGDFFSAQTQWMLEESERRAEAKYNERFQQFNKDREAQESGRSISERWNAQVNEAKKVHADFEQVAYSQHVPISAWAEQKDGKIVAAPPGNSPIEQYIVSSPMGAEIAYYLGSHPEEVTALNGIEIDPTGTQWRYNGKRLSVPEINRRMAIIELSLMPDEAETEPQQRPSAKTVTQAPPPPRQVAGRAPATKDPLDQAVSDEDQDAYMREANSRDLARLKALRGRRG